MGRTLEWTTLTTDMSTQSELIDYFKLDAVYNPDTNSTREVTQTSDRTQTTDYYRKRMEEID